MTVTLCRPQSAIGGEPRQHGGAVAGGAADVEHAVRGRDVGGLDELSQIARPHHPARRAAGRFGGERNVEIRVGEIGLPRRHEALARQLQHGGEDAQVGHVGGADLAVDHPVARLDDVHAGLRDSASLCGTAGENARFRGRAGTHAGRCVVRSRSSELSGSAARGAIASAAGKP
jgi:hypothetical protein